MRFNTKELAYYASTRFGKADKEGALWMKEYEGILKKKESEFAVDSDLSGSFTGVVVRSLHAEVVPAHWKPVLLLQRRASGESPTGRGWLTGSGPQDSVVVGLIIVEKCRVEVESTEGNRNGFRLCERDCVCVCVCVCGWVVACPGIIAIRVYATTTWEVVVCALASAPPLSLSPSLSQYLMKMVLATRLSPTLPRNRMSGGQQLPPPGGCGLEKVGVAIISVFCCSYEYLRMAFSELRGQLMHLTGKVSGCTPHRVSSPSSLPRTLWLRTILWELCPLL